MLDIYDTILSQYANSPRLCTIIRSFAQAADPEAFFDLWYDRVWNPLTATGWGLDVWGRIVGVGRVLQVTNSGYIGFGEAKAQGTSAAVRQFNYGIWYGGQVVTTNSALPDQAYRHLIFAKAAANITDGSIVSLNNLLMILFGAFGRCYVTDGHDMTMTYHFEFVPTPEQLSVIYRSGVLPQPSGVTVSYSFRK